MASLQRILALVIKEFLAILKDRKSRFVVVGPPVIQMIVYGYAATYDLTDVPFAVFNEDGGAASRQLVAHFEGSRHFRQVAQIDHDGQLAPVIDRKDALLVVRIGPRFERDLNVRGSGTVQVVIDGRNSNVAMIALNYVRDTVQRFNSDWSAEHGGPGPPATIHARAWFNPNLQSRWFIVPGVVGLLTLVVTMLVTAMSVAREREQGTFDQLLVTPLRPLEVLVGKALPGFIIGLFEGTLIIVVGTLWFGVPLVGSVLLLYAGLVLFIIAAIGVGLMISSLSVTMQQALLGGFLFMVPAVLLSGFTTPIAAMPVVIQRLTLLNPMRYFMVVLRGVFLEDAPWSVLVHQLWPMALIGLVSLSVAVAMFRRRLY